MPAFLLIAISSLTYRLRGWGGFLIGTQSRRLFWAASIWYILVQFGVNVDTAFESAACAFFGMLISHSKYYTIRTAKEAHVMGIIGWFRMAMTTIPIGVVPCLVSSFISLFLTPLSYYVGTRLSARFKLDSMWIAEPLAGLSYGLCLLVAARLQWI